MLKLADLRKTTRRSGQEGMRVVYPHFLRDRGLAPRIEMAVRYMERMLGRPRRELDAEVIVQLFGDHKIARCIVACLAASYRHRARAFAEVLPDDRAASLAMRGLTNPGELRLWLFRYVNKHGLGFAGGAERAAILTSAGQELGIAVEQLETLMTLDAPEHAVLVRVGPRPSADDVIARFNYETAAALLACAPIVRVSLSRAPGDAERMLALCRAAGVNADLGGRELVLRGQQDALESWVRHGVRLVRLLATLLACGLPARSAEALVAGPMGAEWLFRMDAETLSYLGAAPAQAAAAFSGETLRAAWESSSAFAGHFGALRRSGDLAGWGLRRATEPLVLADGIVPALFTCTRANSRITIVPEPATEDAAARLAALANTLPLVVLRAHDGPAFEALASRTISLIDEDGLANLPRVLDEATEGVARNAVTARLAALCEEARAAGVLTEPRLAERLGCTEEEVAERLQAPAAIRARRAAGVEYVEGFGLCTPEVLTRARNATADVAHLRNNPEVGRAWVIRTLGRKLREVTGASEGIESLIAYLGAA